MKKFIIIAILLISNFSFYGAVNEKGERVNNIQELLENEAIIENQVAEKEQNTEEITKQDTKENENTEEIKVTEEQLKTANNTEKMQISESKKSETKDTKDVNKINETKKETQKVKVQIEEKTTQKEETKVEEKPIQKEEIQAENKQTKTEKTSVVESKKEENISKCTNDKHKMPTGNSGKWFNTKDEAVKYYKSEQKKWSDKLLNGETDDDEYDANCPCGYQNWNCPECKMITLDFYYRIEQN